MDILNLKMPANDTKPAVGKLLIAEPFLSDPNFSRSVIVLCEHNEQGSIGFIINKNTILTTGDLFPELPDPDHIIQQGGPVQVDTLHMLHRVPTILGGNEICPGLYWGGSYEILQDLMKDELFEDEAVKLFVGYAGWGAGQLDAEMASGSWIVADFDPALLFSTAPADVWKQAIRLLGKEYAYLANMPLDPRSN